MEYTFFQKITTLRDKEKQQTAIWKVEQSDENINYIATIIDRFAYLINN